MLLSSMQGFPKICFTLWKALAKQTSQQNGSDLKTVAIYQGNHQ